MRSFGRFAYDSTTARGFWTELAVASSHFDSESFGYSSKVDVIEVQPTFAYGGENWEAGIQIPYIRVDGRACYGRFGCVKDGSDGIGDIQLFGKYVARFEHVHFGGGLDLSLPSGDEDKGFGAGELGVAPFGTAALVFDQIELRSHVGGMLYTESDDGPYGPIPPRYLFYGGGLFFGLNEYVAVRAEVNGALFDRSRYENDVSFQPGVDVRIPLGVIDMLLRPTGFVGLTHAAPDWGVGGAISLVEAP